MNLPPAFARGPWMITGVYVLMLGSRVIYIGQSKNVHGRIEQHSKSRSKPFDRYWFLPCNIEDLDLIERGLVVSLEPSLNSNLKRKLSRKEQDEIFEAFVRYGIDDLLERRSDVKRK